MMMVEDTVTVESPCEKEKYDDDGERIIVESYEKVCRSRSRGESESVRG